MKLANGLLVRCFALVPLAYGVGLANAELAPLDETELSAVNGQDGLSVVLGANTITADYVRLDVDNPNATYPGYNAYLELDNLTLTGVNADGTSTGLPFTITADFDAGGHNTLSTAVLALDATWSRQRMRVDAIRHEMAPGLSYGANAFDTSGQLTVVSGQGLFSTTANNAYFHANVTDGQWFYRQNGNEFVWQDFDMDFGFDSGTVGIDAQGIFLAAPRFDFNFVWDIGYRSNPGVSFSTASDVVPYLRYGWLGGVKDVQMRLRSGGAWVGAESNRTQGINLTWWADADTDFQWVIGDAIGTPAPTVLYFQNWINLPGASSSINVPNLTLDVLRTASQGAGSFLYNGSPVDINTAGNGGGLGVFIRDLSFLSYTSQIRVVDPSIAMDQVFDWGLIYTLGDVDMNLVAYPGGKASVNPAEGVQFDLLLGVQSPSTWQGNTHFMIADTDPAVNTGLGFLNTEFLLSIDNGFVTLLPIGLEMETTTDFRWKLYGQFGGGKLNDLGNPIRALDLTLDLHASRLNAVFIPPTLPATYIGFQWDARLYQTNASDYSTADSSIVISEPSRPDVTLTLGEVGGDLQVRNGKIDLRAGAESADNLPRLAFEQDLRFGLSATNAGFFTGGNRPFIVNDFKIGNASIGSLAIPGGNWHVAMALKEQL